MCIYIYIHYIFGIKKKNRIITWPKGQDISCHASTRLSFNTTKKYLFFIYFFPFLFFLFLSLTPVATPPATHLHLFSSSFSQLFSLQSTPLLSSARFWPLHPPMNSSNPTPTPSSISSSLLRLVN